MTTNESAAALGRLARGKPKRFSPEERERRRARMVAMNVERARRCADEMEARNRKEGAQ